MKTLKNSHFMIATTIFCFLAPALHAASADPTNTWVDSSVSPDEENAIKQKNEDYSMIKRLPKQEIETQEKLNIAAIISHDPSFSTLVKMLEAADLMTLLEGSGPFTLFAPNDAAFAKLSPNTLQDLLKPENKDQLAEILKFHVVPGKIDSSHLNTMKIKSANGKTLEIRVNGNGATVNKAKIVKSDLTGSNGVVYAIDTVMLP